MALDNLISTRVSPVIVVFMPSFYGGGYGEYLGDQRDTYARVFVEEIIPAIEKTYRVLPGRENRANIGHLVNGSMALFSTFKHRDLFGKMSIQSVWWDEKAAHESAGSSFNLASPKQIQEILFDQLGLPVIRKTPKGQPSTSEDVLQDLAYQYELPKLILRYRSMSKLKSTYTDKLPGMVCSATGRVHTSYHQAVAATGRLSSSDPNLQNIPVRTAEGRRIREAFVAPKGMKILSADYSQIELRIMAHFSKDPGLLSAFQSGQDVHRATAAELFGLSPLEVTEEHRRPAKTINFGLIYGMSAFGLARQLGIDRATAQDYIDRYFLRYPGVKAFMDDTRARAKKAGYVETLFGRRLYLPEINARNHARRQYAERTAINAPMQGTAADLIKKAMLAVDQWIRSADSDVQMRKHRRASIWLERATSW